MPNIMLHDDDARMALGRGVAKLAKAVRGTLGPRGMNAIIDRPIGTPIISRDGVSIANEIELEDPFENIGAQVSARVSKQTNEVAGDGTTTATVLADALVQDGLAPLAQGANPVELVQGRTGRQRSNRRAQTRCDAAQGSDEVRAVAMVAANDEARGEMVAEALERVGDHGIVDVEYGTTVETPGSGRRHGFRSRLPVTPHGDGHRRMQVVLDNPLILMTDQRLQPAKKLQACIRERKERPPADHCRGGGAACVMSCSPGATTAILRRRDSSARIRTLAQGDARGYRNRHGRPGDRGDLGGKLKPRNCATSAARGKYAFRLEDHHYGRRRRSMAMAARRQQVARQYEMAPENVERDKFQVRLAKLSGGTAMILAGGATPVEQKRRIHLIEDAINAARAAIAEGVVPGGGMALLRLPNLKDHRGLERRQRAGRELLQRALTGPLFHIATNAA